MRRNFILDNIKNPLLILAGILTLILLLETTSTLSSDIVGLSSRVYPWTLFTLIGEGFLLPNIVALLMVFSFAYGLYACWRGGAQRVIGLYFICGVFGFIAANWAAVVLFKQWQHVNISATPEMSYTLLHFLVTNGTAYHHFMACLFLSYAVLILLFCGKFLFKKACGKNPLGNAHFSDAFEVQKSGLFAEEGIVLGKAFGKTLKLPGFESVLVTAPTGGGKTTSIAIPNLIEWKGSGIFNDLKGELFEKTAKYRGKMLGNTCYRFSPTDLNLNTHRYNPFHYVSSNPNLSIRDLQLIAEVLIPAERVDGGFWYTSSREIFLMLSLYLFEMEGMATLAEIHDHSKKEDFSAG